MRIVKLSELDEEERQRVLEEQNQRIEQNNLARQQLQQQANDAFNQNVQQNGAYNTENHTTTFNKILNAMDSKESQQQFKKANGLNPLGYLKEGTSSIWNKILTGGKTIANNSYNMAQSKLNKPYIPIVTDANGNIDKRATDNNIMTQHVESEMKKINSIISAKKYNELKKQKEEEAKKRVQELESKIKNASKNKALPTADIVKLKKELEEANNSLKSINFDTTEIASDLQTANAKEITQLGLQARLEAQQKNQNLNKGGVDAFNEYVESTLNAIPGGVQSVVAGLGNTGTTVAGLILKGAEKGANLVGSDELQENINNAYENVIDTGRYLNEKGNYKSTVNSQVEDNFTRKSANAVNTVSQVATVAGLAGVTGLPGPLLQGGYVGGSSAQEVLNENEDNIGKATITGLAKGYTSYLTEKMFDANILTRGGKTSSIQKLVDKKIDEKITSQFGKKIANKVVGILGENAEEIVEDNVDNLIDKVVNNKDMPGFKEWLSNTSETMQATTISTIILDLLGLGGTNYEEVQKDAQAQNYINKARQIINENNLTIQYNQNELTNIIQEMKNNENQVNKDVASQIKTAQNGLSQEQKFEYKQSDNQKVNSLREDASKYLNNTEESINYINTLEKIIQDKNIDIRLDPSLTDENGQIANGKYKNGVITINPNSDRAGEFIAIHELTHAIGTDYMRNMVENYRKSNTEFDNAVKSLLENYNTTELTDEAMADVSAQLLGNQEYINNLSMTNPNLFQRIYNEIKYLWHQFRGYTNQNQFINDLQYKWEQAYRNNNNFNESENYSIAGRQSLENIKNDTNTYNQGINSYNTALNLANKNVNNEDIRKQTGWFQDKNGDWKYEFSDEKMSLKNIKLDAEKSYKLEDILNHNDLFTLYPELRNYDVVFDNIKTGGIFKKNDNKIILNKNKINNKVSIEGTLIHEIQHAIQNIEGFENGTNSILSKKAYYENLGEIEADDTKRRFIAEKKGKLDRKIIAPESSKQNPQHSKFNKYMNNRNLIDKMKDGLYNYLSDKIKSRGDSYEVSEENMEQNNKNNSESILQNRKDSAGQVWDRIENSEKGSFNLAENRKQKQNEIIQKSNPMDKKLGEHTWINSAEDIKTYQEAIDEFGGIDNVTPDFKSEDVKKALDTGKVMVYSSYPIEQGTFVTPSKMEAQSYAGNNQIYSKEVNLNDVAWIDEIQGQYAQIEELKPVQDNQGRKLSKEQQEYFKDSKARNNNGELETVYHGTNKAGFTEFNRDYNYFTNNKEMAQSYTRGTEMVDTKKLENISDAKKWLKGINDDIYIENYSVYDEYGEELLQYKNKEDLLKNLKQDLQREIGDTEAGGTYEGYVNITKPVIVDAKGDRWSMIGIDGISIDGIDDINRFLNDNGSSTWKEKGKLRTSTNDIVEAVMSALDEGKIDVDGIIIKNVYDEGGYGNIVPTESGNDYITFNSNQFKAKDNVKPTTDSDIRYSKNNKSWQEYLEKNFPSKGTRTNLNEIKQIAPIKKQAEQTKQEKIAPIGENVKKQNKSFEDIAFDAMFDAESNEVESPLKNRDIETIGKQTKVNAYQYDNPKVKPYFQEMAQMIGEDLSYVSNSDNRSTKKGGGTKLSTTTNAIDTLHNEMGYSYNEIAKGLQNIIDDNGSENNAISKKIELIIDDQLRNGYRNALGRNISPNQEYIDTITTKQEIQKTKEILPTKGDVNWNDIERPEDNKKTRKHYRSIIQSDQTTAEAKAIAKELMGTDAYVPETNKGQLAQADERITNSGPDVELKSLLSRAINGEKISSVDIAVGERLIQYYSKTGNKQQLQEAIQATALAGTSAGQTVQALSLLNHQTPQGQATWIQRSVDKMNKELAKKKGGTITTDENGNQIVIDKQGQDITNKVDLFNLTPEMAQKILNSTEKNMWKNIDEVYEELGQQVPKSTIEKIDSWRYFSMLANPRTHIRNMVGNFAMGKMQTAKNKVAGAIEDVASKFNPNMERSHTLKSADKKTKEFSKNDFKNADVQSRLELNENKYNPQSRLQNARRTFKSDAMEKTLGRLFDLNDNLLEAEDGIGLKAGYIKAMNEYLTANKIDVDKISDKQLNTARNYAIEQAKEATFHQANALATWANQLNNKGKFAKFLGDAIIPFKKTPMNVAKSGVEYSPVGLLKSAILDIAKLRKGNISVNQYIDNISKGLTGTGVALTGYALAKAGILKASGSDDKDKEKYDEEQGKQSYAITIGGKTYSLDWLSPTGIPLFIGAETQKLFTQSKKEKSTEKTNDDSRLKDIVKSVTNIANAGATAINPMSEMSMISGITSALSAYNTQDNLGSLGNMMTNAGKSYINQFVPTLLGQTAKTTDKYERTTTSTKTGTIEKAVDQTINQIKSKVPGLRQTLPVRTDIWGKDKETEPNLPLRALNNFFNPATVKKVSTDKVDQELNKLYDVNGSSSILPDILQKTLTIDNQKYRLTNKEYADYTKKYGETSYNLINSLVSSNAYKTLTQTQKEEAIANIYSFAKESNKIDYANKNGVEVKPSTLYTTMESLKKDGGKQSDYLNYLSKTKTLSKEKDKNQALANSSYSDKTKEIIYTNGTGKDDKLYNSAIKNSKMNITEYLNYKVQESNNSFSADKTEDGKSISGSSKQKYYEYVNKNITGYENRLLILGSKYKLSDTERKSLAEYINNNYSKADLIGVYENLDKNFTVKNGKVYYK